MFKNMNKLKQLLTIVIPVVFVISTLPVIASANCGDIIYAQDYGDGAGLVEDRTSIIDCNNPFNADSSDPFTYELILADQIVTPDVAVSLTEGETVTTSFVINRNDTFGVFKKFELFKQEGGDYRNINIVDPNNIQSDALTPGAYVAVLTVEELTVVSEAEPLWKSLIKKIFLPTIAYAFFPDYMEVVAIPFTVEYDTVASTGASSVLFLPGIMGSRLFEEGDFCDGLEPEKQLWFSFDTCRQLRLITQFTGQSINSVYTKKGEAGILDEAIIINVYKTFLNKLKDWKEEKIISDYAVVPYDWRGELDAILKSNLEKSTGKIFMGQTETVSDGLLYKTLSDLAAGSANGKVTIVAHSNGGLVIKQFLTDLQNKHDPLLDKIDNLILVAVPQSGAPEAVMGMLHGTEIYPVMSQEVSRSLMNTMPFAHHLLPTTDYFKTVTTPVISFESGEATNAWIDNFGETLISRDNLHQFLSKDSGRTKPEFEDLETPAVVDNLLLNYARTTEIIQGNFTPPENMKVYQIAGIGLETPAGLTYFSDRECITRSFFVCTKYQPKISYRVTMTIDGDATVPVPSALMLPSDTRVERRWVNMQRYNNDVLINRSHKDIFEVLDIINFISNTIRATSSSPYTYLSETLPAIEEGDRLIYQLHSPLDMSIITTAGKKVSSSTNEIASAIYRRYGELQYISIPSAEVGTVVLNGLAKGSFTLDVEEISNGKLLKRRTFSAIPSSTTTKVTMDIGTSLDRQQLKVDYDGDGAADVVYNTEGVAEDKASYDDVFTLISDLKINRLSKAVLLKVAKTAEKYHKKALKKERYKKQEEMSLRLLLKQARLYSQLRVITNEEKGRIEEVIIKLLNQ